MRAAATASGGLLKWLSVMRASFSAILALDKFARAFALWVLVSA
jgi:hypothetical protein